MNAGDYLCIVGENGTGKTARPAGYMIGGKTGTAETLPRGNNEYVVSFMGYAPADDPQIAIYVVVDRVNNWPQDDAKYATRIVRNILTEVLPYLGIFMTEELSEKEIAELEELQIEIMTPPEPEETGEEGSGGESGQEGAGEGAEGAGTQEGAPEEKSEPWKEFPIDPATGYAVDPSTGDYVDPITGFVYGSSFDGGETETSGENTGEEGNTGEGGTEGNT